MWYFISDVYNPHQTPNNLSIKQASDLAAPRRTTCTHSSNSDTWPPNGTRHFGSQPLTSRRHSTQLSSAVFGGSCASRELSSHTHRCSERFTMHRKQQCTQTPHANTSTSSRELSRATSSARSCSTHLCNTSGNHQLRSGTETPTKSDLSKMTVTRTSSTSAWQTTFFSSPARDHHAGRPYHSHNSTRSATTPTRTTIIPTRHQTPEKQHCSSIKDDHRDPATGW